MTSALDIPPYNYETPVVEDPDRPHYGLLWPHIQTLQYRASLLEVRTGVRCRVVQTYEHNPVSEDVPEAEHPKELDETFEVLTAHASAGPLSFGRTLTWLDAFEEGINECRWVYSENPST